MNDTLRRISVELSLPEEANPRFEYPSAFAKDKFAGHYRCIGGDKGDIVFDSYTVEPGKTSINEAHLSSGYLDDNSTQEEVDEWALEIFGNAAESIGLDVFA